MRRLLSAAAIAALSIGLLVPAADAATTPIVSYKGLPTNWFGFYIPCSLSGTPGDYSPTHVTGPAAPPAQQGSLRITESSTRVNIVGVDFGSTTPPALSSLTAFSGSVYVPSSSVDNVQFVIGASDGTSTDYALSLSPSVNDAWESLDLTTATLNWQAFDRQSGTPGASGSNTLSDFITAHPGLVVEGLSFEPVNGCASATFYIDNIHYAAGTVDNTVDFEAPVADSFVNGSHPSSVVTGTAVTLSATLSSNGVPLTNQSVGLYAKGAGSSTYKLIKTLTTDPTTGAVSMRVGPSSTTSYQWRYSATGTNYAPVDASAFTITTRQAVSISSKPTSTSYRGTATIKGRVKPYKSGVTVRLVRLVSGKRVVVASAKTTTGGYFTIKAPMTVRGTYSYVVTAAAYTGEAQGQSSSFKIATR